VTLRRIAKSSKAAAGTAAGTAAVAAPTAGDIACGTTAKDRTFAAKAATIDYDDIWFYHKCYLKYNSTTRQNH
jgi:hypothetical protein